ncbi:hypothetical protein EVAR_52903_1 [Eumeta japonica]|uniref:Uncharacterized protein n=1 Tax=Eumeta variegata TaxID=151549 RepID=A0A4C1YWR4_EUMVA|nr:hypothetical protein EVAR_52903_1 [Eumeta japonica]
MNELSVECHLYADDQVIGVPSACGLQEMVTKLNDSIKKIGIKLNFGKTKMMVFERGESTIVYDIYIEDESVEQEKDYKDYKDRNALFVHRLVGVGWMPPQLVGLQMNHISRGCASPVRSKSARSAAEVLKNSVFYFRLQVGRTAECLPENVASYQRIVGWRAFLSLIVSIEGLKGLLVATFYEIKKKQVNK